MSGLLPGRILDKLPVAWRTELAGVAAEPITDGMSGAEVFRLHLRPLCFLKFADGSSLSGLQQEIVRTAWLAERGIRVAPILRSNDDGRTAAMLTQAVPGDPVYRSPLPTASLVEAVGHALATLHALPAAQCPFDESLSIRLARAQQEVERGIDTSAFAVRNRQISARDLLARITTDPPVEDLVVVHGDAALNNMIVDDSGIVGFIDCGHAGRGDRYLDLGVTADAIADCFGEQWIDVFAKSYGEQHWNTRKSDYYVDLYEFF